MFSRLKWLSKITHFAGESLSWKNLLNVMIGVACGMRDSYSRKGIVCHFKCADILVDEVGTL